MKMDLAAHQRQMLQLLQFSFANLECSDAYVQRLAGSEDLAIVREIILWWRLFDLETYCALTTSILKQRGNFECELRAFLGRTQFTRLRDKLRAAFLTAMSIHSDDLVASVARFELALIKVKEGDQDQYQVDWGCDPRPVIKSLLKRQPLPESQPGAYRTLISHDAPGFVRVLAPRDLAHAVPSA
jgi:hypothetical protein